MAVSSDFNRMSEWVLARLAGMSDDPLLDRLREVVIGDLGRVCIELCGLPLDALCDAHANSDP